MATVIDKNLLIDRDLSASGFVIFGKDNQVDKYGPGVDYFHAEDRSGAKTICRILNELISDAKYKLKPRIQSADQPIGTIGILVLGYTNLFTQLFNTGPKGGVRSGVKSPDIPYRSKHSGQSS